MDDDNNYDGRGVAWVSALFLSFILCGTIIVLCVALVWPAILILLWALTIWAQATYEEWKDAKENKDQ